MGTQKSYITIITINGKKKETKKTSNEAKL